ncbi:MAG: UvrD-helicase domain-containing protein [Acidimicrobiales bacterium]
MNRRGTVDFADVVLKARDHARRRPRATYRAAIIDEAQDLTLVGLQLIRALTTDPAGPRFSDSLLIVGDGAQRIYAGDSPCAKPASTSVAVPTCCTTTTATPVRDPGCRRGRGR